MKQAGIIFIFLIFGFIIRIMADLLFEIPFSLTGVVILIIASVMWHFIWRKFVKQDTAIKWLVLYILSFIVGVFILCPLAVKYYVKTMFLSIFN